MLFFLYIEGQVIDWEYLTRKEAIALNEQIKQGKWMKSHEIVELYLKGEGDRNK